MRHAVDEVGQRSVVAENRFDVVVSEAMVEAETASVIRVTAAGRYVETLFS